MPKCQNAGAPEMGHVAASGGGPSAAVVVMEMPLHRREVQHGSSTATNRRCLSPRGPPHWRGTGKVPLETGARPLIPTLPRTLHGHGAVSLYGGVFSPSSYQRDGSLSRPTAKKTRFPGKNCSTAEFCKRLKSQKIMFTGLVGVLIVISFRY